MTSTVSTAQSFIDTFINPIGRRFLSGINQGLNSTLPGRFSIPAHPKLITLTGIVSLACAMLCSGGLTYLTEKLHVCSEVDYKNNKVWTSRAIYTLALTTKIASLAVLFFTVTAH